MSEEAIGSLRGHYTVIIKVKRINKRVCAEGGIEPMTFWTGVGRSTTELNSQGESRNLHSIYENSITTVKKIIDKRHNNPKNYRNIQQTP